MNRERFGNVIIRSSLNTLRLCINTSFGRQQQDGNVAGLQISFNKLAKFDTVNTRHHHVGKNNIHTMLFHNSQCFFAVSGGQRHIVLPEIIFQVIHHLFIVIYQQDSRTLFLTAGFYLITVR